MAFEREFQVAWEHLDANAHAANTAFMQFAINTRFLFFASLGFSPADFAKHRLGPVVRRDEVDYFRETEDRATGTSTAVVPLTSVLYRLNLQTSEWDRSHELPAVRNRNSRRSRLRVNSARDGSSPTAAAPFSTARWPASPTT